MNQRALPSLVLSVLIVCFFAVALFQPDPGRSIRGRPVPGADGVPRQSGAAPSLGSGHLPPDRSDLTPQVAESPSRIANASGPQVGPLGDSRVIAASRSVGARTDLSVPEPGRLPRERALDASDGPVRRAAHGSSRSRIARAGAGTTDGSAKAHQPSSAFTVARPDETIEDIALRVYGTTERVSSLWRANRDTLLRQDSPVSAGMLLRTPRIR
jgi:hypothetical protein